MKPWRSVYFSNVFVLTFRMFLFRSIKRNMRRKYSQIVVMHKWTCGYCLRISLLVCITCSPFQKYIVIFRILSASGGLNKFPLLKDDFEDMLSNGCDSPYLISFLVDFYEEDLEKNGRNESTAKRAVEVGCWYPP